MGSIEGELVLVVIDPLYMFDEAIILLFGLYEQYPDLGSRWHTSSRRFWRPRRARKNTGR